jgi:hypothetical protein
MSHQPRASTPHEPLGPRTRAILALLQGLLPAMTAIVGGLWIAWTYLNDQRARSNDESRQVEKESARSLEESRVSLLEAQKLFLDKKLEIFLETAQVSGKLVNTKPNSPEWNQLRDQFWSLRWSKMEMVGTPAIRERMRAVGEALNILENKPEGDPDRGEAHYLRWMVECLADEVRTTLESSWQTEIAYDKQKLPAGCRAGFEEPPTPKFVPHAPGVEPPRTPSR